MISFEDAKQRAWQWKKAIEGLQHRWICCCITAFRKHDTTSKLQDYSQRIITIWKWVPQCKVAEGSCVGVSPFSFHFYRSNGTMIDLYESMFAHGTMSDRLTTKFTAIELYHFYFAYHCFLILLINARENWFLKTYLCHYCFKPQIRSLYLVSLAYS